jgi:hypothetical protein
VGQSEQIRKERRNRIGEVQEQTSEVVEQQADRRRRPNVTASTPHSGNSSEEAMKEGFDQSGTERATALPSMEDNEAEADDLKAEAAIERLYDTMSRSTEDYDTTFQVKPRRVRSGCYTCRTRRVKVCRLPHERYRR